LSGEDGEEHGQDHDLLDGAFKRAHHGGGKKRRQEIQLQPRMAELEAAPPGCGQPVFPNPDHATGLGTDPCVLLLEQNVAADQPDQYAVLAADRIDRVVFAPYRADRLGNGCAWREKKRIADHDVRNTLGGIGQEHIAHDQNTQQYAVRIRYVTVGDEGLLDHDAQHVHRFPYSELRPEEPHGLFHQASDRVHREVQVHRPLLAPPLREQGQDGCLSPFFEAREDLQGLRVAQQEQYLGDGLVGLFHQRLEALRGRILLDVRDQGLDVLFVALFGGGRGGLCLHHQPPRIR